MKMKSPTRLALVLPCVVLFLLVATTPAGGQKMYDLDLDPLEATDIYGDSDYSAIQTEIETRLAYFQGLEFPPVYQPTVTKSVWNAAGGVVPWEDYDDKPAKTTVEGAAPVDGAPNIVFILLDDVGYNDVGLHSTWLDFTTPYLDNLAGEGIQLSNYYTAWLCSPTRASLLTGRYPIRTGYWPAPTEANLPLSESTLAQELQALGYRTALVGKWHLGYSQWAYTPTFRGFDYFYGYYGGAIGYVSKLKSANDPVDLHDYEDIVVDSSEIDTHLTTLLQEKVEGVIEEHATSYPDQPLFLSYAMQNVHTGSDVDFEAPDEYVAMCSDEEGLSDERIYCALMIMLDEAIANTVCALEDAGLDDNTVLVVASDNGGLSSIAGSNYPFKGAKGAMAQGGVLNTAIIHGPPSIVPQSARGSTYDGLVHVTDWFPTLLGLASNGTWTTPLNGYDVDGVDVFSAVTTGGESPRTEVLHNYNSGDDAGAMQVGGVKLVIGGMGSGTEPAATFSMASALPSAECSDPSLALQESPSPTVSPAPSSAAPSHAPTTSPAPTSSEGTTPSSSLSSLEWALVLGLGLGLPIVGIISWAAMKRRKRNSPPSAKVEEGGGAATVAERGIALPEMKI